MALTKENITYIENLDELTALINKDLGLHIRDKAARKSYRINPNLLRNISNWSAKAYENDPTLVVYDNQLYLLNTQGTSPVTLPYTSSNFITELAAGNWVRLGNYEIQELTQEPTGFRYPGDVITNYDAVSRTVTLTGTPEAYWKGEQVTELVSGWTSTPHPNTTDAYFLYYNGSAFGWSTLPWSFNMLQIIYVAKSGLRFGIRETHGLMQWQTHQELHSQIGTYIESGSGGDFSNYVEQSTTAAERRPYISALTVDDEDLPTTLPALTTNAYSHFFLTGTETTNINVDQTEIIPLSGNQPYYNQFTGGAWVQTLMPNGSYAKAFVIAIPVTSDTISQKYRFIWAQPQAQYGTLAEAQAVEIADFDFGDLRDVATESVVCGEYIIGYLGGNWEIEELNKVIGNRVYQQVFKGSGLSNVSVDGTTVTGDGTATNPLIATGIKNYIPKTDADTGDTLTAGYDYSLKSVSAAWGLSLTALFADGDRYRFYIDNATDTHTITINGSGINIEGSSTYVFGAAESGKIYEFTYNSTENEYKVKQLDYDTSTVNSGAIQLQYSDLVSDADPGSGFFRLNNASQPSATFIYADDFESQLGYFREFSKGLTEDSIIKFQVPTNRAKYAIYKVSSAVLTATGYTKIPVTVVATGISFALNDIVEVVLLGGVISLQNAIDTVTLPYSTSISLTNLKALSSTTLTANDDYTPIVTTSISDMNSHTLQVDLNGFTPTFSGFDFWEGYRADLDTTVGYVNLIIFFRLHNTYYYSIGKSKSIDITPPTLTSATIENATDDQVDAVYNEVVTLTDLGYTVSGIASSPTIIGVSGSGTAYIAFELSDVVVESDTPLLSYDSTIGDTVDASGNPLASFTDVAITNNVSSLIQLSAPTAGTPVVDSSTQITVPITGIDANTTSVTARYKETVSGTWLNHATGLATGITEHIFDGLTAGTEYDFDYINVGDGVTYSDSNPSNTATATTSTALGAITFGANVFMSNIQTSGTTYRPGDVVDFGQLVSDQMFDQEFTLQWEVEAINTFGEVIMLDDYWDYDYKTLSGVPISIQRDTATNYSIYVNGTDSLSDIAVADGDLLRFRRDSSNNIHIESFNGSSWDVEYTFAATYADPLTFKWRGYYGSASDYPSLVDPQYTGNVYTPTINEPTSTDLSFSTYIQNMQQSGTVWTAGLSTGWGYLVSEDTFSSDFEAMWKPSDSSQVGSTGIDIDTTFEAPVSWTLYVREPDVSSLSQLSTIYEGATVRGTVQRHTHEYARIQRVGTAITIDRWRGNQWRNDYTFVGTYSDTYRFKFRGYYNGIVSSECINPKYN